MRAMKLMRAGSNNLYLDSENRVWLGVCSGLANWLDIPAAVVRIIFILCALAWPPMLIGYVILYFCLDKDFTPDKMRDYFSNTPTAEHFRKLNYRKPIYKNERDKRIAGVCAGIADYLEVSHFAVRVVTVLSLFVFGPFTFWAYVICWFVFDPDPYMDDGEKYERKMRRRERRAERRRARYERRQARRHSRKMRKSYRNKEFNPDMESFEEDIADVVDDVNQELKDEIDEAINGFKEASTRGKSKSGAAPSMSRAECTKLYASLEMRLREIEAFMTSKKFRLHCEINRI